jgi:peroxiredoxin
MNHKVLTSYGILKKYPMQGDEYEWAERTTFVIDKDGKVQHIEQGGSAVNPNNAVAVCTGLHEKEGK